MLKKLLAVGVALGSSFAIATTAQANAGYHGQTIENAELGEQIEYGAYTITRTGTNTTLGNGVDESISWLFDFSEDKAMLDTFLADTSELIGAELILLDIEVGDILTTNDLLGIPGYKGMEYSTGTRNSSALIELASVADVPDVGGTVSFSIDLFDHNLDAEALMGAFMDDTDNLNPWYNADTWVGDASDYVIENQEYAIPFIYMDDAIIRQAQLVLHKENSSLSSNVPNAADVPEPAAMAGLIVAGTSLLMRRRQQPNQAV
ncbi:MAG: PEP-CTERM sorting domain-containing protein [Cyanobacteria bacterium P01_B01_bin.77]